MKEERTTKKEEMINNRMKTQAKKMKREKLVATIKHLTSIGVAGAPRSSGSGAINRLKHVLNENKHLIAAATKNQSYNRQSRHNKPDRNKRRGFRSKIN